MKKSLHDIVNVERIRSLLREIASPTFLIILLGAALLWYTSKLSGQYVTEIPMHIRIDGEKYRLTAIVEGRGSAITAQRLALKRKLNFTLDELSPRPSRKTLGAFTIAPSALQNAINGKITALRIVQVMEAPEFIPPGVEAKPETETETDVGGAAKIDRE